MLENSSSHDSVLLPSFCLDLFVKLQTVPLISKKTQQNNLSKSPYARKNWIFWTYFFSFKELDLFSFFINVYMLYFWKSYLILSAVQPAELGTPTEVKEESWVKKPRWKYRKSKHACATVTKHKAASVPSVFCNVQRVLEHSGPSQATRSINHTLTRGCHFYAPG